MSATSSIERPPASVPTGQPTRRGAAAVDAWLAAAATFRYAERRLRVGRSTRTAFAAALLELLAPGLALCVLLAVGIFETPLGFLGDTQSIYLAFAAVLLIAAQPELGSRPLAPDRQQLAFPGPTLLEGGR